PNPRNSAVNQLTITFSEAVSGFDLADIQLQRGGASVALSGATLSSNDSVTWTLANLSGLTAGQGDYVLTLTAAGSGIQDSVGNALAGNANVSWHVARTGPPPTWLVPVASGLTHSAEYYAVLEAIREDFTLLVEFSSDN